MSLLHFNATTVSPPCNAQQRGSLRAAHARWILDNHGADHRAKVRAQRWNAADSRLKRGTAANNLAAMTDAPLVGIVGGGFAGMFAGLILQSLGIEFELFESSDRVGGRIHTWYSQDYDPNRPQCIGLYGELGGMRLPQFSEDMLPVQQLALAVNAVLARNGLHDKAIYWRKFHYYSPQQRLRYNNMNWPTTAGQSALDSLNFDVAHCGDVPLVWVKPKLDGNGEFLPIKKVLDQLNAPFLAAINRSFAEGFELLMQFDEYSMWDYLTTQFRLGDLGEYYDPAMGRKSDLLPWSVANFLETTKGGTGTFSVSFVEMVILVYDWNSSNDPYRPDIDKAFMLTVDQGMQCFPDACRTVLDLQDSVNVEDGNTAQIRVGMLPRWKDGPYNYDPPNLRWDAQPPNHRWDARPPNHRPQARPLQSPAPSAACKKRVHLQHEVIALRHERNQCEGQGGMRGGMRVTVRHKQSGRKHERTYPYVVTTLPNCAYLNGEKKLILLEDISFEKAQAIRECNYMASFKAFLTFKSQFWTVTRGVATTDRPIRQIVYPSYGYAANQGVLQVYCWAQDARRLGALGEKERIEECLKGIQYIYPDVNIYEYFAGYEDGVTTKTWFWDQHAGGGAFAMFRPGQFKNLYPAMLTPEFDGCLNFAGECCSAHHGWIVGALDSAYNAVLNILHHAGEKEKIEQMRKTWGTFQPPDIEYDPIAVNEMLYVYEYNLVDRCAASAPPSGGPSIYGCQQYIFDGQVPAFVANYDRVPQSMKSTKRDKQVLDMLNANWNDNIARRAQQPVRPVNMEKSVKMLEDIYYGNNFQTIPAPKFWLRYDDEFARQQLAGFMPTLLERVSTSDLEWLISEAGIPDDGRLDTVKYVANYRRYLEACTITPVNYYLAKPLVFFTVNNNHELMPVAIQLDKDGELFTPDMDNAENAWLLAKMQTNCAGHSLHDVGFHHLLTNQICTMVSIALFSEEVFNPNTLPCSDEPFQQHPVFKLLRPHVVKTVEFQQSIYNRKYNPYAKSFPATRVVNGAPGAYNIGFTYDLTFSCGRIGNYQLQDKMYYDKDRFRFLDLAIRTDAKRRGVDQTRFSYAYVHDACLWYDKISLFVDKFIAIQYSNDDQMIAADIQLQRFFSKLIPAFNHVDGTTVAHRFPDEVKTVKVLHDVLTLFIWQFSVQHTVVSDGAYNQAAFVPNASTLMHRLPAGKPSQWTPYDVLACLPSQTATYPELGNMNFMDIQIKASVTGQGPYPETMLGRGVLEPSLDFLQDSYNFINPQLRDAVSDLYRDVVEIGEMIAARQVKDTAKYLNLHS
ncbi:hypothetical protein BGZ65_004529, partial [Modicella reniformis]